MAVIGLGGVGVAAIAGAALAGASPIIAVDIDAKKFKAAELLGATHTVDSSQVDPVQEIKRICAETYDGADGADVVVEAVGRPETWKQAFYARDLAGTVVLVGVPTPDMTVPKIPLIDVFGRGGAFKSSWYGDCLESQRHSPAIHSSCMSIKTAPTSRMTAAALGKIPPMAAYFTQPRRWTSNPTTPGDSPLEEGLPAAATSSGGHQQIPGLSGTLELGASLPHTSRRESPALSHRRSGE